MIDTDLIEHMIHRFHLLPGFGMAGINNVEQQVRVACFFQR